MWRCGRSSYDLMVKASTHSNKSEVANASMRLTVLSCFRAFNLGANIWGHKWVCSRVRLGTWRWCTRMYSNFMESGRILKQIIVDDMLHCLTEKFPFCRSLLFYNLSFAWQFVLSARLNTSQLGSSVTVCIYCRYCILWHHDVQGKLVNESWEQKNLIFLCSSGLIVAAL